MRTCGVGLTRLAWMGMAVSAGLAAAADYSWVSGGPDNNWTTLLNWQGGPGYPATAGDIVTVTAADTVNLDTGGTVALGRLQLTSTTPKAVIVTGNAGAGFTFSGIAAPDGGIRVAGHADNRLVIETDIVIPIRLDRMGPGTVEFTGTHTGPTGAGTIGWVFGQGKNIFSGTSSLTLADAMVGVGNAGFTSTIALTNQAAWNVRNLYLGVATTVNSIGVLSQDSDECSVTVPAQLIVGQMVPGNTNGYYYLRKGTLTANAMTVGSGSPGRFEQSGGTQTVQSVTLRLGEYLQTEGQASLSSIVVGNGTTTPAFTLQGGELTVPTALTLISGSFRQTGGQSYLQGVVTNKAASLDAAITLAGGKMTLDANIVVTGDPAKQVFNLSGGTLQVTNTYACAVPVFSSGTATIDTPTAGKVFTLAKGFSGNGQLVKTGAGSLFIGNSTATAFSGSLTISNGVFNMGANTLLESYGQSEEPLGLKICSGGIFRLGDISSIVTVPLALDIEAGGKIDFAWGGSDYNRNILVAHSIITNGVSLPPGRYTTAHGFLTGSTASCSVVIPVIWTGAGDGVSWSDPDNWAGGTVPDGQAAVADLSNARQPVRIDSALTLTCLVYTPQGANRSLTLTGSGSLTLFAPFSVSPSVFVGNGRSLTLDVALQRTPAGGTLVITGGGTVIVKKNFPSISVAAREGSAFAIYGNLVFAGDTTVADTLGMWRHENRGIGSVIFTNGCHVSCPRILNNPNGFFALNQVFHDGGEVTCGDLFMTRHNSQGVVPYTYFMRSGTLTTTGANGVNLGIYLTSNWVRYLGGSFVMSGGTVSTARLAMGMPDNVIDLHGGEVNLGSGGIISTTNIQGTVKLGGVALRAAANWSSALNMALTGVNGNTLLDTAARTVTLSGALSGAGGLVKTGAGTLNLDGATNTFSGPLLVAGGTLACGAASVFSGVSEIAVTNGTLALNGAVLSPDLTLRVSGTGTLTLPAGAALEVSRLYLSGSLRPAGTYTFGGGTVTVRPTAKTVWTGAADDGALWSNINNWSNTVAVPDGPDAVLDFGYSQLAADDRIVLDVAAGVTLASLAYGHGVPGCVLTLTCPASVTNTLTFVSNGVVRVEEGQTLVLDTDVLMKGPLRKYGAGTLILNRRVYGESEADTFWFFIMEGQVRGRGEMTRLRVQPASATLLEPPPEFVLEGEAAVLRGRVIAAPGYQNQSKDRGVFTQEGGVVDQSTLPAGFYTGTWGCVLTYGAGTEGAYYLKGGTYATCPERLSFLAGGGGTAAFNQTGGTSTFHRLNLTWAWPSTGGQGALNLSGGTLRLAGTVEKGYSAGFLNFSGGRVETLSNGVAFAADVPVALATGASGDVAFAQAQAAYTNALPGTLSGSGGLVQEGPGTLALNGVNAFGGSVTVKGGTLLVSAPLQNAADLFVDGGRLELLAEAPSLTNLSVRAAGSAVRIDGGATPFPEGLTLSLAQGLVTELDFDGIADVGRLVLGGQAKSPGLYGGVDSQAPAKPSSAYFTGSGTLRVLYGPQPRGTMMMLR